MYVFYSLKFSDFSKILIINTLDNKILETKIIENYNKFSEFVKDLCYFMEDNVEYQKDFGLESYEDICLGRDLKEYDKNIKKFVTKYIKNILQNYPYDFGRDSSTAYNYFIIKDKDICK